MKRALPFFMTLLLGACAGQPVHPLKLADSLAANEALVAFSVDSETPVALREFDFIRPGSEDPYEKIGRVRLHPDDGHGQLFLFAVPVSGTQIGNVRFEYKELLLETESAGPVIRPQSGAVTYLGRVRLHSVRIARFADSGRAYPSAARITVANAADEDFPRLRARFGVSPEVEILSAVTEQWNDSEFQELRMRVEPVKKPGLLDPSGIGSPVGLQPVGPDLPRGRDQGG